jgi:hypothetical protein
MPRNHKPRNRYVPKRVDPDPMGLAMTGAALLTPEQLRKLFGPLNTAFDAFRTGRGTPAAWCDLADAMNVAEALAERNIANDHAEKFLAAQGVLADVHGRSHVPDRGSYTLYAAEIVALDDAVFMHRIQLEHCSQRELLESIEQVKRRVQAALAGNASPRARICVPGALGRSSEVRL